MSEEKIITRLELDPDKVKTAKITQPRYCQLCLLCDNTREIPHPNYSTYPWICDECKEAMSFLKDFLKHATVTEEMLNEMENLNENIYPL